MLEGLEAVEVEFNECKNIIDFRIDANTYKKDYIKTDKLIKSIPNATIEELSISVQNFGAYSLCNDINFTDSGIPFLMTQNVRHNYIDWNIEKFVDEDSHRMLWKSHCHNGQVLVTMAGEYLGRAAVYDKTEVCSSNQAIAKISFKKNTDPYIISSFLNSRYGQNQINRLKTITGQPNINMSLIKSLIIPSFSNELIDINKDVMLRSQYLRDNSFSMYEFAKNLLLEELGLKDWEPTGELISIKSFSDFMLCGRLDAEYYQPKYNEIEAKIKAYRNGYDTVENCFVVKDSNFIPNDNDKYQYIELSNIGGYGEISGCTNDYGLELPSRARRIVNHNDIIVSSVEGSLQSCAIVPQEYDRALCSTGFYILEPKHINAETSLLLFKSFPIQQLMKKICSGTILTAMNKDEFLSIPIPIISREVQIQVAEKIQESFVFMAESKRLLSLSQTAIETAVEYGEAQAIKMFMK